MKKILLFLVWSSFSFIQTMEKFGLNLSHRKTMEPYVKNVVPPELQDELKKLTTTIDRNHEIFKKLSDYVRHNGIPNLFKNDPSFKTMVKSLNDLTPEQLQGCFIGTLDNLSTPQNFKQFFIVFAYADFFKKNKLRADIQEIALEFILKKYSDCHLGRFFLNIAVCFGLDLNVFRVDFVNDKIKDLLKIEPIKKSMTRLEYIAQEALKTDQTVILDEAANILGSIDRNNQIRLSQLFLQQFNKAHTSPVLTILNKLIFKKA